MNMDKAAQTDINERGGQVRKQSLETRCFKFTRYVGVNNREYAQHIRITSTYKMSYIPACLSRQTRTPPPAVVDQPTEISDACTRENVCDLVRWQIIMYVQSTASAHKAEH